MSQEREREIRDALQDTVESLRPGEQLDPADYAIQEVLAALDESRKDTAAFDKLLTEANRMLQSFADNLSRRGNYGGAAQIDAHLEACRQLRTALKSRGDATEGKV